MKYMMLTICFVVHFCLPASASDCVSISDYPHWVSTIDGPENETIWEIVANDNWLYVKRENKIVIYDVSDPAQPQYAGEYETRIFLYSTMFADNDMLILNNFPPGADSGSLSILDLQNPVAPTPINTISYQLEPTAYYYVLSCDVSNDKIAMVIANRTLVVDFSLSLPPDQPRYSVLETGHVEVALDGNRLYTGNTDSLVVYDVSDVANVKEVGHLEGNFQFIAIDDNLLLSRNDEYGFSSYRLHAQSLPSLRHEKPSEHDCKRLFFADGLAIEYKHQVVHVTPVSPEGQIGDSYLFYTSYTEGDNDFRDIEIQNNFLYFSCVQSVDIYDLAQGTAPPTYVADLSPISHGNYATFGDHLYKGSETLQCWDTSEDAHAVLLSETTLPPNTHLLDLAVVDQYLFASCSTPSGVASLAIYNLAEPLAPALETTWSEIDASGYHDLSVHDQTLWFNAGGRPAPSLYSVDISTPSNPLLREHLLLPPAPWASIVGIQNGFLHVALAYGDYKIYRLDSSPPVEISGLEPICFIGKETPISNGTVYLPFSCVPGTGVDVIDISDPYAPSMTGSFGTNSFIERMGRFGPVLWLQALDAVHVVDNSDPSRVFGIGTFHRWARLATLPDGRIYRLNDMALMPSFCELVETTSVDLQDVAQNNISIYPNPFNPRTTIQFDLPAPTTGTVVVYNLLGRRVRTLLRQEHLPAGINQLQWNGRNSHGQAAASGVYLIRLETPTATITGRMVLLR